MTGCVQEKLRMDKLQNRKVIHSTCIKDKYCGRVDFRTHPHFFKKRPASHPGKQTDTTKKVIFTTLVHLYE